MHQRSAPFTHRFRYGLSMIDIDVDRLEEASTQSRLFSTTGPALFSFREADHATRAKKGDLRDWAEQQFKAVGFDERPDSIRLLTFPRHWFFKFAPISVWLAFDKAQNPTAILYEVHNTFGEMHTYAAMVPEGQRHQHEADKVFHVSPFFDISGKYRFTLRLEEKAFSLVVATMHGEAQTHMATLQVKARPATSIEFAKLAITKPFSSLGVTLAIHWQALKLWIKGARYNSRPKLPDTALSRATPIKNTLNEEQTA